MTGFFERLGDPNDPLAAMVGGLGAGLLRYGEPSVGEKSFGGAFGAGVNGMLNGILAQRQANEEEKKLGLLNKLLEQQMGIGSAAAEAAGINPNMPTPEMEAAGGVMPESLAPPVQTQMPAQPMGVLNQPPMPVARPQTPMMPARPGMGVPGPRMGQPTPEEEILLGLLNQPMMAPTMQRGPY